MATCHSLTIINTTLAGDPLDLKMFEATDWVFGCFSLEMQLIVCNLDTGLWLRWLVYNQHMFGWVYQPHTTITTKSVHSIHLLFQNNQNLFKIFIPDLLQKTAKFLFTRNHRFIQFSPRPTDYVLLNPSLNQIRLKSGSVFHYRSLKNLKIRLVMF